MALQAAREIEPGHYGPKLSESAAKARDDFYQIECIRAGGTLVDSTDPTLNDTGIADEAAMAMRIAT